MRYGTIGSDGLLISSSSGMMLMRVGRLLLSSGKVCHGLCHGLVSALDRGRVWCGVGMRRQSAMVHGRPGVDTADGRYGPERGSSWM